MKSTKKAVELEVPIIELNAEEIKKIWDFFDILTDIEVIVPNRSTHDVFQYLVTKWAYQYESKGDPTIYIDEIERDT